MLTMDYDDCRYRHRDYAKLACEKMKHIKWPDFIPRDDPEQFEDWAVSECEQIFRDLIGNEDADVTFYVAEYDGKSWTSP
jgi:hypothetical protein